MEIWYLQDIAKIMCHFDLYQADEDIFQFRPTFR